jgi:hypothetical protein
MAILVKFSPALLFAGSIALAMGLPRARPEFQPQTTPTPSTDGGKQPDTPSNTVQTQPHPDTSGKYHVGNGVSAPILIYSEGPERSYKLLKKKIYGGSCTLSMTVDTDGKSQDVRIVKSFPDINDMKLRDAVIEMQNNCTKAAEGYRFKPATYQGKPVPVELKIEIDFY